ncbi:MAG: hypothetical protein WB660_28665 [Candidatus Sulfotelmatobacter sp.]
MKLLAVLSLGLAVFSRFGIAQDAPKPQAPSQPEPRFVTVPITLDHDRVVVDVDLRFHDGTTQRVRAWVDNGDPDLYLSQRLAELTGGSVSCDGQLCSATPPVEMNIGGMTITLGGRIPGAGIKVAKFPAGGAPIALGMSVEINIPSTVLSGYDVLINLPERKFSIGHPGSLKFRGVKAKVIVNPANGLIQVPSQIENKKYNLALDVGSSISFLADDVFDRLASTHRDWPHMTGAVGPANIWGLADEPKWKLMRIARVQYGPLFFIDLPMVDFPKDRMNYFEKRAGILTAGLLGANALINYRIGIDYAHSTVYFDVGRLFNSPDFDVIGLILRPEDDGRFTILGIADYDGKPSVAEGRGGVQVGDHLIAVDGIPTAGSTLGQVWSMLGGEAGKERTLRVEREGKQFNIVAKVQRFLAETEDSSLGKKSLNH